MNSVTLTYVFHWRRASHMSQYSNSNMTCVQKFWRVHYKVSFHTLACLRWVVHEILKIWFGVSHINYSHIINNNSSCVNRMCPTVSPHLRVNHTHTHMHTHTPHTHTCTYTGISTHIHPQARTDLCTYNAHAHVCAKTNTQYVHMNACVCTHACARARAHTHTHRAIFFGGGGTFPDGGRFGILAGDISRVWVCPQECPPGHILDGEMALRGTRPAVVKSAGAHFRVGGDNLGYYTCDGVHCSENCVSGTALSNHLLSSHSSTNLVFSYTSHLHWVQ